MTTPRRVVTLWRGVESTLQAPVEPGIRQFCALQGWVDEYLAARDAEDRESATNRIVLTVRHLRQAGLVLAGDALAPSLGVDGRWRLLQELDAAYHASASQAPDRGQPWQPLLISRLLDLSFGPSGWRVQVSFDDRVSLRTLSGALRRAWPGLLARKWLRHSRPLEKRALSIVRFVCIEAVNEKTWRARWQAWNRTYPRWALPDVRQFERLFRRAELQLTGQRLGLEWYYDPLARMEFGELIQAHRTGVRGAQEMFLRRQKELHVPFESLRRALDARARARRRATTTANATTSPPARSAARRRSPTTNV